MQTQVRLAEDEYLIQALAAKKDTGNGLNYQSIGSGGGIKQIEANTVTFGATDKPLDRKELDAKNKRSKFSVGTTHTSMAAIASA